MQTNSGPSQFHIKLKIDGDVKSDKVSDKIGDVYLQRRQWVKASDELLDICANASRGIKQAHDPMRVDEHVSGRHLRERADGSKVEVMRPGVLSQVCPLWCCGFLFSRLTQMVGLWLIMTLLRQHGVDARDACDATGACRRAWPWQLLFITAEIARAPWLTRQCRWKGDDPMPQVVIDTVVEQSVRCARTIESAEEGL